MTPQRRLFRLLLGLYPRHFRDRYGDEMTRLFAEQSRDAEMSGGRLSLFSLLIQTAIDIVVTAPGHHLAGEVLVPQPIDAPSTTSSRVIPDGSTRRAWTILGLLPIWIQVFSLVAAPAYFDPMFDNPPGIAGFPAGFVLNGLASLVTLAGVAIIRRTAPSRLRILTFVVLTVPAAVAVIFAPAAILILQNPAS